MGAESADGSAGASLEVFSLWRLGRADPGEVDCFDRMDFAEHHQRSKNAVTMSW